MYRHNKTQVTNVTFSHNHEVAITTKSHNCEILSSFIEIIAIGRYKVVIPRNKVTLKKRKKKG